MFTILANGFEHSGEERGSNDLVFDCLWVCEYHGESSWIGSVEEFEVFVVGTL